MKLRDKIKESQMRLVELSSYLNISRPTLYRYLELYEAKEFSEIDRICLDLFTFIDNSKAIKRPAIMEYLINKILPVDSADKDDFDVISNVRKLSLSNTNEDKKKMKLIGILASSSNLDFIVDNMLELSKKKAIMGEIPTHDKMGEGEKENG